MRNRLCALLLFFALTAAPMFAGVIVGGTRYGNLGTALTDLGIGYTTAGGGGMIDPTGYGPGDILVMGMDGGLGPYYDYNGFLNAGGHVVLAGGSNTDQYRTWAAGYFNTTDTSLGWHTDGAWHKYGSSVATQYMPGDYTFGDVGVSYHMLAFVAAADTVLLGTNDEPQYILALRSYSNGGAFEYLALDPGQYGAAGDIQKFTEPFIKGALEAAAGGAGGEAPEPATFGLIGLGIGVLALRRKLA